MPSPYLQRIAKETGQSIKKFEPHWEKAKSLIADNYGKLPEDLTAKQIEKEVIPLVKEMAGIRESKITVQDFINSDKSVDEFISETLSVTSSDFPSLQTNVIAKDDDNEEDEFDEPVRTQEETINESHIETGPYIDSPKRMEIQQQWVEKGDKLMIDASYEDIDGRYKIEVRIPHTNKTQWVIFNNKAVAKQYGFLPKGE